MAWVKHYTHMRNLSKRLATLATVRPKDWVVERLDTGFQFDPIRPAKYAESALFLRVPKIIFISATIQPKTMYMLGIAKEQFDFIEFDSDFPPERCPIYYIPTMRVDYRQPDNRMLWMRLDQIASSRRDRKGIVHTVSFARRDEVVGASRFSASIFVNARGEAPTDMIENFRLSPPGSILVSPSVGAGYDFPGRDCEWQFLCKIPFQPPSNVVKAREALDSDYRGYEAMHKAVQIFGRGMRGKDDCCEGFIGDEHLEWFWPKFKRFAPRYFHQRFVKVDTLPAPPERLL